jgi:hypothetical protein
MLIDGELSYPIYKFEIKWKQSKGSEEPFNNGTGFNLMKKEAMSEDEIESFKKEWWEKYQEKSLKGLNTELVSFGHSFYFETWCLLWFNHETFDVGQSDEEALASFERYVSRHEDHQRGIQPGQICLMGAEDRWRWRGADEDGAGHTPAPCRCEGCKESGMIRINH